jgi:anaerobic selenocysteine-containing dehydrogenase
MDLHGYCALCVSRCGAVATVEDGRLVKVAPDPAHPTGQALCAKGRESPGMVNDPRRLTTPLIRTGARHAPDPCWREAGWDEALDLVAERLRATIEADGPESLVVGVTSPSGTAISDAFPYIFRLAYALGTPNIVSSTEICQWHRDFAAELTYGYAQPAPDLDRAGCVLLWGHNPKAAWLARAVKLVAAQKRGAAVIVVDPRRAGPATRADCWLRVRPGADAALALGLAAELIRIGGHDEEFVRAWTNAPLLVGEDGLLLRSGGSERAGEYVGLDAGAGRPRPVAPGEHDGLALSANGEHPESTAAAVRTVWDLLRTRLDEWPPERVEEVAWVPADRVRAAAELLADRGPVCYATWSGVGQSTNATQTDRAISTLYALTGDLERAGGNVRFAPAPLAPVYGWELLPPAQAGKTLGLEELPLGPPGKLMTTTEAARRAMIDGDPYPVRAMLGYGLNWALSQADSARTVEALGALDFHVQLEHTMTPTAELADVVLPVSSFWEHEALWGDFEVDQRAAATVQLRPAAVAPAGSSRSDLEITFDLATRLGVGEHFWHGDVEAGWNAELAPTGITVAGLRETPGGRIELNLETPYRSFEAEGFPTPTGRLELYSEPMLEAGHDPIADQPPGALRSQEGAGADFPLVLTCAKLGQYCQSQHRGVPRLRRKEPEPEIEVHPRTAEERGIAADGWVRVVTPHGAFRARAALSPELHPSVVVSSFGWWQDCPEIGAPGHPPFEQSGSNYNLAVTGEESDPVSGSVPLRGTACELEASRA